MKNKSLITTMLMAVSFTVIVMSLDTRIAQNGAHASLSSYKSSEGESFIGHPACDGEDFFEINKISLNVASENTNFLIEIGDPSVSKEDAENIISVLSEVNKFIDGRINIPKTVKILLCETHHDPTFNTDSRTVNLVIPTRYLKTNGIISSAQEALPIAVHEYGHAIFEENIESISTSWAEMKELTYQLTDLYTVLKNRETGSSNGLKSQIEELESQLAANLIGSLGLPYHELFADALTVFFYNDGKEVARLLADMEPLKGAVADEWEAFAHLRDFTTSHEGHLKKDNYSLSAQVKTLMWKKYQETGDAIGLLKKLLDSSSIALDHKSSNGAVSDIFREPDEFSKELIELLENSSL